MSDLVAFLNARLDDDEAAAKAAWPGPWTYETEVGGFGPVGWVRVPLPPHENAHTGLTRFTPLGTQDAEICAYIARHDPARALREVEAKRAILVMSLVEVEHGREVDYDVRDALETVVRQLAAVYSDHPDYDPEWKP